MRGCSHPHDPVAPPLTHFVILRGDLPHGLQVAQTIHAAGESAEARVPHGTIAVALAARDEPHLLELAKLLRRQGIDHTLIIEGDGEHAGHAMSIGIAPTTDRRAVGKVVSNLPLVR